MQVKGSPGSDLLFMPCKPAAITPACNKYGFAEPAWRLDHIYKHLRVKEVIGDSSIFTNSPFNSEAKDFIINSGRSRYTWMAFSLASTINNFESNIKNIGVKYGN